jgi:hypothetical protein
LNVDESEKRFTENYPFLVAIARYKLRPDTVIVDYLCRDYNYVNRPVIVLKTDLETQIRKDEIIYKGALSEKEILAKPPDWLGTTFVELDPISLKFTNISMSNIMKVYGGKKIVNVTRDDVDELFLPPKTKTIPIKSIVYPRSKTLLKTGNMILFSEEVCENYDVGVSTQIRHAMIQEDVASGSVLLESYDGVSIMISSWSSVMRNGSEVSAEDLRKGDQVVYSNAVTTDTLSTMGKEIYTVKEVKLAPTQVSVRVEQLPLKLIIADKSTMGNLSNGRMKLFSSRHVTSDSSINPDFQNIHGFTVLDGRNGWTAMTLINLSKIEVDFINIAEAYGLPSSRPAKESLLRVISVLISKRDKDPRVVAKRGRIEKIMKEALGLQFSLSSAEFNFITLTYLISENYAPQRPSDGYLSKVKFSADYGVSKSEFTAVELLICTCSGEFFLESEINTNVATFKLRTTLRTAHKVEFHGTSVFGEAYLNIDTVSYFNPPLRGTIDNPSTVDRREDLGIIGRVVASTASMKELGSRLAFIYNNTSKSSKSWFVGCRNPSTIVVLDSRMLDRTHSKTGNIPNLYIMQDHLMQGTRDSGRYTVAYSRKRDQVRVGDIKRLDPSTLTTPSAPGYNVYSIDDIVVVCCKDKIDQHLGRFLIKKFFIWFIANDFDTVIMCSNDLSDREFSRLRVEINNVSVARGKSFTGMIFPKGDPVFSSTHDIIRSDNYLSSVFDVEHSNDLFLSMTPPQLLERFPLEFPSISGSEFWGAIRNLSQYTLNDSFNIGVSCTTERAIEALKRCTDVAVTMRFDEKVITNVVVPDTISMHLLDNHVQVSYILEEFIGKPSRLSRDFSMGNWDTSSSNADSIIMMRDLLCPSTLMNFQNIIRLFTAIHRNEAGTGYKVNMKFADVNDEKRRSHSRMRTLLVTLNKLIDLYQDSSKETQDSFVSYMNTMRTNYVGSSSHDIYRRSPNSYAWTHFFLSMKRILLMKSKRFI